MKELTGNTPPDRRVGSRTRRYVLITIGVLSLGMILLQVFLRQTSVGSPKFVRWTFLLWSMTFLVVLALTILATVLGRNLIKLYFERKSGQVGSRFKTRLVSAFVILSLLPALLLFFLAFGLINFSIEQWFSAPAAQMLENSRDIALQYYADAERQARHFAARAAGSIESEEWLYPELRPKLEQRIESLRVQYGLASISVYDPRGGRLAEAGRRISGEAHASKVTPLLASALRGETAFGVDRATPQDALREVIWAAAPVRTAEGRIVGSLLTENHLPSSLRFKAYSVLEAYEKYEQLQNEKITLRFNFLLMLALSTLLVVFGFSWFGMYLAKRITGPIEALAQGAAEVAAGNLDHRVECPAFDELEGLVSSFNRMTMDLQENKANIEQAQEVLRRTNVELDERHRYIETILQNIATGVVSLDSAHRIRTLNPAAAQILQIQGPAAGRGLEEVVQGTAAASLRALLHRSALLGSIA
jgi:two-component system nitrogen regulation sensor histidine kinase NtrY